MATLEERFERFEEFFKMEKPIGSGVHGTVYKVIDSTTGKPYAAKIIPFRPNRQSELTSEATITKNLNSGYILPYYGLYIRQLDKEFFKVSTKSGFYFIMPMMYIEGSSLDVFVKKFRDVHSLENQRLILLLMKQVFSGLRDLHAAGIAHGDIKDENAVINERDYHLYLIDLGFACIVHRTRDTPVTALPCERIHGTPLNLSPEVYRYSKRPPLNLMYGNDVWAAGVMFYELLSGEFPYYPEIDDSDERELKEALLANKRYSKAILPAWANRVNYIIELALTYNPIQRPTAEQMVEVINKELSSFPPLSSL